MQPSVYYNSDLEQKLLQSLTVREGEGRHKRTVRFDETTHHKERPSRKHQRDSQRTRESPGLPGSRRYNRHQNKMELLDKALSDSESELEIEVDLVIAFKSPFKVLFEDAECAQRWEPFLDITEEAQHRILTDLYPASSYDHTRHSAKKRGFPTDPAECFQQLNREEKYLLRRQTGNPVIEQIEKTLMHFVLSRTKTRLDLVFAPDQKIQRVLFHCCCVYYSLRLEAEELEDGTISETARKPKGVQAPAVRLADYLNSLRA